ncbi:hypothetical protein ACJMK2_035898 [Sinanodonta woodiana]|uniref:Conserved oligomeric Golgi complex subunit 2 n=1 Tax=Sinanodonta woodiana TaxID=1069815 RepID=A0ABD3WHH9_SINWO
MTGDPVRTAPTLPLPSGPTSLCFDKDDFMKENFDIDRFIMECRRHVPLEDLRDDLNVYLKILRSAMIELINKDYADFVNLSTNLVGMDKAIGSLKVPLEQLKEEVLKVRSAMEVAKAAAEEKLKKRQQIKDKKACLQRLINITQSVDKIERLLGIQATGDAGIESGTGNSGQLDGQLIERVATEFNKLQFYVTKSKGLPLVEIIKPRIANITTTLQYSLEGSFLDGVEQNNIDILRQCLRTYALIDKIKDVENLFRNHVVKPYMEEVVSEQFLKSNKQGLQGMYAKILEFIPTHCRLLREVTSKHTSGSTEVVRGFDFLVNAVWPEAVSNIEARTPSIFAPGNPDVFHAKFLTSMQFLDQFERLCGYKASVKRFRDHPSYHTFMTKWSLPVYFQIRFQEIAGAFEGSLMSAFTKSTDSSKFLLHSTETLWASLRRCWDEDVFLFPLCHRFWKLSVQMLMRYSTWLDEAYTQEVSNLKDCQELKAKTQNERPSTPNEKIMSSINNIQIDGHGTPTPPATPPVTIRQILSMITDAEKLVTLVPDLFDKEIKPRLQFKESDADIYRDCFIDCCEAVSSKLPQFREFIVEDVKNLCSVHLKLVSDIPRLYRRTNRDVPSKPSAYIGNLVKPLRMFVEEHGDILGEKQKSDICQQVFTNLAHQYYTVTSDVLTSVKKMEDSLKRLKKVRGTEKSSGSLGMSDDDKIRQQLILDIDSYGDQLANFGLEKKELESFQKLLELSDEAKSSMTSRQS